MALNKLSYFPNGGLDWYGYVYWPYPADDKPFQMSESGRKEDAFRYCMRKFDEAQDDEKRLFYACQATTLAYGLKKPHLVALKLDAYVQSELKDVRYATYSQAIDHVSPQIWLAYAFARAASDDLAGDRDNKYDVWATPNMRESSNLQRWGHEATRFVEKHTFKKLEHRYVKSSWAWLMHEYGIARKLLDPIAKELDQPGPYLTLSRYWTFGTTGPGNDSSDKDSMRFLTLVRKRWPTYDRAIFYEGLKLSGYGDRTTKPQAQKGTQLLLKYLQISKGPKFEQEAAKRALDRLKPYL